jgi:uncharacterized protein (TIGR03435 family)
MTFPAVEHAPWVVSFSAALVNHLWQSTVVVALAWLVTLALRKNQARTRYWVWMVASLKFAVPFWLLIAAGEALRPANPVAAGATTALAVVQQMTQPFPQGTSSVGTVEFPTAISTESAAHAGDVLPWVLFAVWLCGVLVLAVSWVRSWAKVRAAVQGASPLSLPMMEGCGVRVLSTATLLEPGVFGLVKPVVLLPLGITERLSEAQLRTIVAHELTHIRRRDNLTAALHMLVATVFWFHPTVWGIKARLLEERERACDEAVLQSGNDADVYAESILTVCRFYVESPVACVAGVTGSDLKERIVRIMTEQSLRKLDLSRKVLLAACGVAAVAMPLAFGVMDARPVHAQAADANSQGIVGTWQGTLHAGRDLRIVFKIAKDGLGYTAMSYSVDQGGAKIPVKTTTFVEGTVKMTIPAVGGSYEGKLSADGKTINGSLNQGAPLELVLTKATPETEWAIPEPPPPPKPMDANANPTFEVATIKPTKPDEKRKMITIQDRKFVIVNQSLNSLISFAYGVHAKQIVNAQPWMDTDKYDITAQPDGEGQPSEKQWREMLEKLLADRFKLSFHRDKKELAVYVLSVGKGGPKLEKDESDPNGLPGLFFRGKLGDLGVRNANMGDFVHLMQSVVLDRPVVDQTGITGRYDFTLKWTPDDSQFGGEAVGTPPSTDSNPPPNLYTAIQEQIGLKLDATKAPAEVLVIDRVEKPSEN